MANVVQKFVPRSHVGIFRNEHIRSTPLHRKLTFWCVSYYLGAFGTVWLPYETWYKTGRASAKVRATKSRRNFYQRMHPIHPHRILNCRFGAFCTIWLNSGPFGCLTKLGAKWAELVQKFVPRSCIGIFRNERTRSTPLDPKIKILERFTLFRCILDHLVALRNSGQNVPN